MTQPIPRSRGVSVHDAAVTDTAATGSSRHGDHYKKMRHRPLNRKYITYYGTRPIKLKFHGSSFLRNKSGVTAEIPARMSRGCYAENGPVESKLHAAYTCTALALETVAHVCRCSCVSLLVNSITSSSRHLDFISSPFNITAFTSSSFACNTV